MKSLIPSHRENKRYLFIRGKSLKENLEKAILDFSGVLGLSKCGLSFIKTEKDSVIICINREAVDLLRASIAVYPEKMEVLKVSGTLKGLKKWIQKFYKIRKTGKFMEMQINTQEIVERLNKLQEQVDRLQEEFEDTQLSEDDLKHLKLAEEEYKNGETISHEELKKELGIWVLN